MVAVVGLTKLEKRWLITVYLLLNPLTFRNQKIGQNGNVSLNSLEAHQKLDQANQTRQINTILYCMGEESEEVLASVNAEEEDQGGEHCVYGNMKSKMIRDRLVSRDQ